MLSYLEVKLFLCTVTTSDFIACDGTDQDSFKILPVSSCDRFCLLQE